MALRDRVVRVGTASLHEAAGSGSLSTAIKPIGPSGRIAGRAVTVRTPAGDNLIIHHVLRRRFNGEVLVVDAGQSADRAVWGEVMSVAAKAAGLAGLVLDGAVRDFGSMARVGFPIYARGVAIPGPSKNGPGEADSVIRCGGATVSPGDWIVADEDGVVVLAAHDVEAILAKAEQREATEQAIMFRLASGTSNTCEELGLAQP